ncbi:AraC family transcriptional regulator [Zophobihabitans entericus]|uniref:AraC family transcriptional regulator n=1 Tax=Zophobihabitans entericus TaxID=1635327 RepID=A0A6G9IAS0_9GAMM|nr:AraC family transcriptional regulator [Zophobihabitans entericus]QIQ20919.1 AraC family transcriptional regulator [Zophobihabitans entericus]
MPHTDVYKRDIYKNSCLAFKTVTDDFRSTWHAHPEFEIVYIESGFGCLHYGKQQHIYQKGDIFVLGPWVPHEFLEKSKNHHSISLLFNNDFIIPGFLDCELAQEIKAFLNKARMGLVFNAKMEQSETDIIKLVLSQSGLDRAIHLLFLLRKFSEQPVSQVLSNTPEEQCCSKTFAKLQDILAFIHKNAYRKLLLDEVATQFYMSRNHLSRFFTENTGFSFSQYLLKLRIERASELLLKSTKPITHVSEESGFDSISSFNRSFLREKGLSPREFRKQLKNT